MGVRPNAFESVMGADPNALGYVMVARSKTPESGIAAQEPIKNKNKNLLEFYFKDSLFFL